MRLPLAVRHLSSFETCLTETPFGVFRAAVGHVSQCEKASFVVLVVGGCLFLISLVSFYPGLL